MTVNMESITGDKEYLFNVIRFEKYLISLCEIRVISSWLMVGIYSPILQQFAKGLEGCLGIDKIEFLNITIYDFWYRIRKLTQLFIVVELKSFT